QRPVHAPLADRAEPDQVRENRIERAPGLQPVQLPELLMAVPVRRVRELDGDVRPVLGTVEARTARDELVDELLSDEEWEEVVDDDPLVVPRERPPRIVEDLALVDAVLA